MAVKKKRGISVGFNITDARKKLDELKKIVKEKEELTKKGGIFDAKIEKGEKEKRTLSRQKQGAKSTSDFQDLTSAAAFDIQTARKKLDELKKIVKEKKELVKRGGIYDKQIKKDTEKEIETRQQQSAAAKSEFKDTTSAVAFDINDARKKLEKLNKIIKEKENTIKRGGIYGTEIETGTEKRTLTRKKQAEKSKSDLKDSASASAFTHTTAWEKMKQKQKDLQKNQKDIETNLNNETKQRKQQEKLIDNQNKQIQDIATDPFAFLRSKALGAASAILPLSLITQIYSMLYSRIEKEFGPGGRYDLRKLIQNQVYDLLEIKKRIDRDRGAVFFASDYDSLVYQGAPGISNTVSLSDGYLRDRLIDPGR